MLILHWVRKAVRSLGLDVVRYTPGTNRHLRLAKLLHHHGVTLVLDVGANTGQYAHDLFAAGYRGRIVSFEPQADAHQTLARRARGNSRWQAAERCALGSQNGTLTLHVARNSVSSSALPMLDAHLQAAPNSDTLRQETVPVYRLDAIADKYIGAGEVVFLKIDTQGYEPQVLAGAQGIINAIMGVQVEMSLVPLYEGQELFDSLRAELEAAGFVLCGLDAGFTHPQTGRMLQVDGVFMREAGR
jgi:FkbM family methyltransferase